MSDEKNNTEHGDAFTLEDILAEYKSEAYIAGERKLPVDEMQKRAEDIVREAKVENDDAEIKSIVEPEEVEEAPQEPERKSRLTIIPFEDFERYKNENAASQMGFDDEEKSAPAAEPETQAEPEKTRQGFFVRLFGRKNKASNELATDEDDEDGEEPLEDEIPDDEPELKEIFRAYAKKTKSLGIRSFITAVLSIAMILLTVLSDSNFPFSRLLNGRFTWVVIVLLVLQVLVTVTGFDIIVAGIKDIVTLKSGAESLVTISCLASLMDAAAILITKNTEVGAPFSAVAACSMFFALLGAFYTARAYTLSFRSAATVSEAYCVTAEDDRLEGGRVLVKSREDAKGFITRSHQANLPEKALAFAAPVLILASVVLSLLSSLGKGNALLFFHYFASIAAVSAPFSMLLIFGHPFKILAARLSAAGAAVAGWQGVRDIGDAVGIVVRDDDIFPIGTLAISGINIISGASRDKVLSYTGSIIMTSGSGLTQTFSELLENQHGRVVNIEEFTLYEGGGLSGGVGSDRVFVGSSGFMNLMGIRVQENMNIKNAIFCAINGSLSGVFLVDYIPTKPVRNALVALLSCSMMTFFALRDFNITTMMLRQKFKIPSGSAENIDVLTFADRYRLSDPPLRRKQPAALIFREGLGPYASVVLGGRSLQTSVRIGTVISILGAVLGAALMYFMCSKGAFTAATSANTLIFMLAWLLPTFMLSRLVSRY